jgi:hypothetical protein
MDVSVGEKGEFGFGPFLLDPVRRRLPTTARRSG